MDSSKYVDSKGNVIKIGDRVKFKAHYGYQGYRTMESVGKVVYMNTMQSIVVEMEDGQTVLEGGKDTSKFWLHGEYDSKAGVTVFGTRQVKMQFDYPTVFEEYCLIQGEE